MLPHFVVSTQSVRTRKFEINQSFYTAILQGFLEKHLRKRLGQEQEANACDDTNGDEARDEQQRRKCEPEKPT